MKRVIIIAALFAASSVLAADATKVPAADANPTKSFVNSGTWTGDNMSSSAPTPACWCDEDPNVKDCADQFDNNDELEPVCYDEYIPDGSNGYVHATIFVQQAQK